MGSGSGFQQSFPSYGSGTNHPAIGRSGSASWAPGYGFQQGNLSQVQQNPTGFGSFGNFANVPGGGLGVGGHELPPPSGGVFNNTGNFGTGVVGGQDMIRPPYGGGVFPNQGPPGYW